MKLSFPIRDYYIFFAPLALSGTMFFGVIIFQPKEFYWLMIVCSLAGMLYSIKFLRMFAKCFIVRELIEVIDLYYTEHDSCDVSGKVTAIHLSVDGYPLTITSEGITFRNAEDAAVSSKEVKVLLLYFKELPYFKALLNLFPDVDITTAQ